LTPEVYIPLLSALVGTLIGAAASILTVWIQARIQDKRARMQYASGLALEDYKLQLDLTKLTGAKGTIPPVTLFLHYHLELAKLMEKGTFTTEEFVALTERNREFMAAIEGLQR
jgi:hypothetical protein